MLFITVQVEPFVFLLCVAVKMEYINLSTVTWCVLHTLEMSYVSVHVFQSVKGGIFVHTCTCIQCR